MLQEGYIIAKPRCSTGLGAAFSGPKIDPNVFAEREQVAEIPLLAIDEIRNVQLNGRPGPRDGIFQHGRAHHAFFPRKPRDKRSAVLPRMRREFQRLLELGLESVQRVCRRKIVRAGGNAGEERRG